MMRTPITGLVGGSAAIIIAHLFYARVLGCEPTSTWYVHTMWLPLWLGYRVGAGPEWTPPELEVRLRALIPMLLITLTSIALTEGCGNGLMAPRARLCPDRDFGTESRVLCPLHWLASSGLLHEQHRCREEEGERGHDSADQRHPGGRFRELNAGSDEPADNGLG